MDVCVEPHPAAPPTQTFRDHLRVAAFEHPIDVRYDDGRWSARAASRLRAGA